MRSKDEFTVVKAGLFVIDGSVKEGTMSNKMTGSVKQIQDGTLLLTFTAALGGQVAYFTELASRLAIK